MTTKDQNQNKQTKMQTNISKIFNIYQEDPEKTAVLTGAWPEPPRAPHKQSSWDTPQEPPIDRAAGTAEPEPTGSVYQSKAMPAELHGPKSDVGTNKPLTHDLHEIMSLLITLIINKQRMPNIY